MQKKKLFIFLLTSIIFCCIFCFTACQNNIGQKTANEPENTVFICEHDYSDYIITDIDDIGYRKEYYCKKCHEEVSKVYIYTTNIEYALTADKSGAYVKSTSNLVDTEIVLRRAYNNRPLIKIADSAFKNCGHIKSVITPSSIVEIGDDAFSNCTSLINIELQEGITKIGNNAFNNCNSLANIKLPNSVMEIGDNAFNGCCSLVNLVIPSNITKIGIYAFNNCSSLLSVYWNAMECKQGSYLFSKSYNLLTIYIGKDVKHIPNYCFAKCNLNSVFFNENVLSIGNGAFENCDLRNIDIPNSVMSIGFGAFWACPLESVSFSDTTTWFKTDSKSDWQNNRNGVQVDLTDIKTNAKYFSSDLCYWYKE